MKHCANCGKREDTIKWVGEGGALDLTHGFYAMWCKQCALTAQIAHAEQQVARLTVLRAELATLA